MWGKKNWEGPNLFFIFCAPKNGINKTQLVYCKAQIPLLFLTLPHLSFLRLIWLFWPCWRFGGNEDCEKPFSKNLPKPFQKPENQKIENQKINFGNGETSTSTPKLGWGLYSKKLIQKLIRLKRGSANFKKNYFVRVLRYLEKKFLVIFLILLSGWFLWVI